MMPSLSECAGRARHNCETRRPRLRPLLRAAVVLAFATLPGFAAPAHAAIAPGQSAEMQFALAAEATTLREYAEMLRLLRLSAEGGYLPAQESLAMALLNGQALFGSAVPRDVCGAFMWFGRAAVQGSAIGRRHVTLLNRTSRDRLRACP
jgi:TPR repeat protein